jgi:hypothetical protein
MFTDFLQLTAATNPGATKPGTTILGSGMDYHYGGYSHYGWKGTISRYLSILRAGI